MIQSFTVFEGERRLITGSLAEVALAVKRAGRPTAAIIIFSDASGRSIDLDLRGSDDEIVARLPTTAPAPEAEATEPRGRGRPKLGVIAREVTLLPRHWDGSTPSPARRSLRKRIDETRRSGATATGCVRARCGLSLHVTRPATSPTEEASRAVCRRPAAFRS